MQEPGRKEARADFRKCKGCPRAGRCRGPGHLPKVYVFQTTFLSHKAFPFVIIRATAPWRLGLKHTQCCLVFLQPLFY